MTTSPHSGSEGRTPSSAFERLDRRVRAWVYRQQWTTLRDIQEHAIAPILAGEPDIVISAGTASGKTEAAFLPICSELVDADGSGVQALYVGPLKALINDQFERLDRLCEHLGIPVHRWHGDVGGAAKQRVVRSPSGILLITPESLEALFVRRGPKVRQLFAALRHVVVDELHAYLGQERGRQLQSLLHRLEETLGRRVQRIGLSATLGDVRLAAEGLRPGAGADALLLVSEAGEQEVRLQVRGYRDAIPKVRVRAGTPPPEGVESVEFSSGGGIDKIAADLFATLRGSNNLVFANARSRVEEITDRLARRCESERVPVEFFAHHGSLAKDHREFVEEQLKRGDRPATAVCTSTLEMGIDIGRVASIALVGPPHTVASLRQRLGRSGRRGDPAVVRLYCLEPTIEEHTRPQDRLRPRLVQAVAMVQLLLCGWCEPPEPAARHLSTLVQQTLSLVRERGGASAQVAWQTLCRDGPFSRTTARQYGDLLRDLATHDLVMQLGDGTLVLGAGGERLTDHYSFYTAFQTQEEWTLMTEGRVLGTLPIVQPLDEGLLLVFAGRRWRVASVNEERRDVFVVPAPGGAPPSFGGEGGLVHDRVRREMRAVLAAADMPVYLDVVGRDLLDEARQQFARYGLVERDVIADGVGSLWFPWIGDRVMDTLVLELQALDVPAVRDGIAISFTSTPPSQVLEALAAMAGHGPFDAVELATTVKNKRLEKHDVFLRDELLSLDYAAKRLDVVGAYRVACDLARLR